MPATISLTNSPAYLQQNREIISNDTVIRGHLHFNMGNILKYKLGHLVAEEPLLLLV